MTKTELIERIKRDGRLYFKNGSSRTLRAGEIQIVLDAIDSVWPDDDPCGGCEAIDDFLTRLQQQMIKHFRFGTMITITWNDLAVIPEFTDFVQWAVANHGPLPDGPIRQEDYDRLLNLYYARGLE